jgi:hypothetical protein
MLLAETCSTAQLFLMTTLLPSLITLLPSFLGRNRTEEPGLDTSHDCSRERLMATWFTLPGVAHHDGAKTGIAVHCHCTRRTGPVGWAVSPHPASRIPTRSASSRSPDVIDLFSRRWTMALTISRTVGCSRISSGAARSASRSR